MDGLIYVAMLGLVGWLVVWVMQPEGKSGWWPFETRDGSASDTPKQDKRVWRREG